MVIDQRVIDTMDTMDTERPVASILAVARGGVDTVATEEERSPS